MTKSTKPRHLPVRPPEYDNGALRFTHLDANRSRTEVAQKFGHYDEMHLVHDFEQLSGETPGGVLTESERARQGFTDAVRMGRLTAAGPAAHRLFL